MPGAESTICPIVGPTPGFSPSLTNYKATNKQWIKKLKSKQWMATKASKTFLLYSKTKSPFLGGLMNSLYGLNLDGGSAFARRAAVKVSLHACNKASK